MPNLLDSFRDVVRALDHARVPFAVCGGLAMSIHAQPRATVDIDLLSPPTSIDALVAAVAPLGFVRQERHPVRLAQGQIVMHRLIKIDPGDPDVLSLDVIEASPGVAGDAWAGRISRPWLSHEVAVVSRDGLIALKRLRGSPLDQADIAALERA